VLAVAITIAPKCLAIWIAGMPMPPAAPWISTFSPARSRPRCNSAW
jgi:hypothetical protein